MRIAEPAPAHKESQSPVLTFLLRRSNR